MLVSPDPTHICECVSSLRILRVTAGVCCRTAIGLVSEGSKRVKVKTATLSFKLNHDPEMAWNLDCAAIVFVSPLTGQQPRRVAARRTAAMNPSNGGDASPGAGGVDSKGVAS